MESRVAGIATIPGREAALADVIERILPQVDHIHIACNNYDGGHRLDDGRRGVSWHYPDNGRQDGNKYLYLADGPPGYRFPLDDDILYPPTLIRDSIDAIEGYGRKCVVSWGGKRYDVQPVLSYYRGMSVSFHALHTQPFDFPVHVPLSGAMAWHTSMLTFNTEHWIHPLMADLWAGLDCLEQGVPIMSLSHDKGYLVHSSKIDLSTTIYQTEHLRDSIQTKLVNREWPALRWPT